MAVTKIRKISSWTLLICSVITIVVLAMFFLGGSVDPSAEMVEPIYTGLLLNWMYALAAITTVSTLIFAIWQFAGLLKIKPKSALLGLGAIILFVVMLLVCYSIGDPTPLPVLSADAQKHNVDFWLKITDMWIYSIYILTALTIIAILAGSLKKIFSKK
jgi:hypothetical protein